MITETLRDKVATTLLAAIEHQAFISFNAEADYNDENTPMLRPENVKI